MTNTLHTEFCRHCGWVPEVHASQSGVLGKAVSRQLDEMLNPCQVCEMSQSDPLEDGTFHMMYADLVTTIIETTTIEDTVTRSLIETKVKHSGWQLLPDEFERMVNELIDYFNAPDNELPDPFDGVTEVEIYGSVISRS